MGQRDRTNGRISKPAAHVMLQALRRSGGDTAEAATALGVDVGWMQRRIDRSTNMQAEIKTMAPTAKSSPRSMTPTLAQLRERVSAPMTIRLGRGFTLIRVSVPKYPGQDKNEEWYLEHRRRRKAGPFRSREAARKHARMAGI